MRFVNIVYVYCVFAQVIFITEYMSSGSLKQFLKRTKRNVKKISLTAWKRWCTQILSALRYVLALDTPILLVLGSFYFFFKLPRYRCALPLEVQSVYIMFYRIANIYII